MGEKTPRVTAETREHIKGSTLVMTLQKEFRHRHAEVVIIPRKEKKRKFGSLDMISANTKRIRSDRDELPSR